MGRLKEYIIRWFLENHSLQELSQSKNWYKIEIETTREYSTLKVVNLLNPNSEFSKVVHLADNFNLLLDDTIKYYQTLSLKNPQD